jgi:uncharacterized repeat protein (TIGR03803 family)
MSSCLSICDSIYRALKSSANVTSAAVLLLILSPVFGEPATAQSYTLTTLYSFAGSPDGAWPLGIVLDSQGNLYGSTQLGGLAACGPKQRPLFGCGTVFKLDTAGHETVLHRFTFSNGDGMTPWIAGTVIRDSAGNLYGTTFYGGDSKCFTDGLNYGCGMAFKLDPSGRETVLHKFEGAVNSDGAGPGARLVQDGQGNLYGTTNNGGDINCTARYYEPGCGTVFKIDTAGHETILYRFTGANGDGVMPTGLVIDARGNLYGTTTYGGAFGYGTVFRVDSSGNETILYSFRGAGVGDGASPISGLTLDSQGNLYGATLDGGTGNCNDLAPGGGTVFKLSPSGQETVLYRFTGTNGDTCFPSSELVLDDAGNLFGFTAVIGYGAFYKVDASGHETVLYKFPGIDEPFGLLAIPGQPGSFYGALYQDERNLGTIFKLTPNGD